MHELVIRAGAFIEGTGTPRRQADVAVDGGLVTIIGIVDQPGKDEVDATGRIVTPGFVDPHTHLDTQIFWEPAGSPPTRHGVTTVNLSSCGFGIAPCPPRGRDTLLRCLEAVEEIPFESMNDTVPKELGAWADYMDQVGTLALGTNVTGFVPHSALRFTAMGSRAFTEEATSADLDAMVAILAAALDRGAVGLSTSRGRNHVDGEGRPVPSRLADDAELEALVATCAGRLWQVNLSSKLESTDAMLDEIERYAGWSRRHGVTLSWTPLIARTGDVTWIRVLEHNRRLNAEGGRVLPQVCPLPIVLGMRFDDGARLLPNIEGWANAFAGFGELDVARRGDRLRDDSFRQIVSDSLVAAGTGVLAPRLDVWTIGASVSRPELSGMSLREAFSGSRPLDELWELVLADDLQTIVQLPVGNDDVDAVAVLVNDEDTLVGLGDAGAHVASIVNYTYPTDLLATFVRDRGALGLERAIHELTARPAHALGLGNRGTLAPGAAADICVIDLPSLSVTPTERRNDLPGGGARLVRGAVGYDAVFVNGVQTIAHDEPTHASAGRFVPCYVS